MTLIYEYESNLDILRMYFCTKKWSF